MNRRPVQVQGPAIHLAAAISAQRIPGLISASFIGSQIRLEVPEAEFSIWVGACGPDGLVLRIEAVFRELGQDRRAGGTWWNTWDLTVGTPAAEFPEAEFPEPDAAAADRPRERRCVPAERTARALSGEIAVARRRFADLLAEAREQGRAAA
ncbi:hypothetical protein OHS33_22100 [Streptomyces sp. NBC_00536]|uniref:hypothetical protein n=1 Tax=Streptomyces sp. NBC_00536 TaxID=2975769 RepID=UPI002E81F6A1|nr:hypothetical protein [Streptomyces sp. NBC_00536]WUC80786.1 hypothetical protein OHS33_22100 [Streptomyces sp. NBC_00536]